MSGKLVGKKFVGIIADYFDEKYPTKYFVHIPSIVTEDKLVLVENKLNNYSAVKLKNTTTSVFSGSYAPLIPGTKVIIEFRTNKISTGMITELHYDSQAVPPGQAVDSYYLITETPNGSRIYFDDSKNRFHISNSNKTDFFMDDNSIIMQTSDDANEPTSSFELSKNGLIISFGERSIVFSEAGFSINSGDKANTFINITDKGIAIKGEEFLSFDTQKLDIRGESVNFQSMGQMHVRANTLNLTGTQKAALNSSVVHVEGWLSTYLKAGLTLNLESKVFYRTQSLINDETNLAYKHVYSAMESKESTMSAETSTFKANAIGTMANDGVILNNLGVAASVAPSLAASIIAASTSIHLGFMAFGTFMSLDNIASSVVGSVLSDAMIADTASIASPTDKSISGVFFKKDNITKTFLNELHENQHRNKLQYSEGVRDYYKTGDNNLTYTYDNFTDLNVDLSILSSNFLKG
jgi:hypothetical protein